MSDYSLRMQVTGLKELQKQLRAADPAMAKRLQQVNKKLAQDIADKARGRASAHVSTRTKASIKGSASGREARVSLGGERVPEALGNEFGGSRNLSPGPQGGRNRFSTSTVGTGSTFRATTSRQGGIRTRTRQFPPWNNGEGYFLYPTVRAERDTLNEQWLSVFDEIFATSGGE